MTALGTLAAALLGCSSEPKPTELALATPERRVDVGVVTSVPIGEAEALLRQALQSDEALLRANAIEALQLAPEILVPALPALLRDSNRGVRYVAAVTVGELRLASLVDDVRPLLADEHPSVQAAAIFAMRQCGEDVDPSPLAGMLRSTDPEVKGNSAFIIGRLGNRSAIPLLKEAIRWQLPRSSVARKRIVELQIAEALVKLGVDNEMEVIRAALFAPAEQGEITALAAQMCGKLRDEQYAPTLQNIAVRDGNDREPAEVRLAAVWALTRINPAAAPSHVAVQYSTHESPAIRAQAAHALARIDVPQADEVLARLIRDPNPVVQVSAAGAILTRYRR